MKGIVERLLPVAAGFAAVFGLVLPLFDGEAGPVSTWDETGALVFVFAVLVMAGENLLSITSPMGEVGPQGRVRG